MLRFVAYVQSIEAYRAGDRSEKFRVSASYEMANVFSPLVPQSLSARVSAAARSRRCRSRGGVPAAAAST